MNVENMSRIDSILKGTTSNNPFAPSSFGREGLQKNWRDSFPEIIGQSPVMQKLLQNVFKISYSDSSVLIYGESGTGKELIANALHRLSRRSSGRFVAINCSAIPETLLESELFGHERGAFTGADRRRPGLFEVASNGTVFLDEIGDMAPSLQAKLLRVLQEKKYCPVGGNEYKTADVRVIAATNVDLQRAVLERRFREDLYYRLNVLPIHVPLLKDRTGDVEKLIEIFLHRSNLKHADKVDCYLHDDALKLMLKHDWPGNVRELQNVIERMVVMSGGGEISCDMLPAEFFAHSFEEGTKVLNFSIPAVSQTSTPFFHDVEMAHFSDCERHGVLPPDGIDLIAAIENLENSYIMQALQRTKYNKNQAAKLLGLNRTTLVERIKKRKLIPLNAPSQEL